MRGETEERWKNKLARLSIKFYSICVLLIFPQKILGPLANLYSGPQAPTPQLSGVLLGPLSDQGP